MNIARLFLQFIIIIILLLQNECRSISDKKCDTNELNELISKADTLYNNGDYINAIVFYSQVLKIDENIPKVYYARANCYSYIYNYPKSIDDYFKCVKLKYRVEDSYLCLGLCYEILYDFDRALVYYEKVIEINPNNNSAQLRIECIKSIK